MVCCPSNRVKGLLSKKTSQAWPISHKKTTRKIPGLASAAPCGHRGRPRDTHPLGKWSPLSPTQEMDAVGAAFPDGLVRQPKEFHEDGGDLSGTHGSEPSLHSGTVVGKDKRNLSSERVPEDNPAPGDFEEGVDVTWEMSKENVMPLARGRNIETIRRAFAGSAAPQGRRRSAEVLAALKRCLCLLTKIQFPLRMNNLNVRPSWSTVCSIFIFKLFCRFLFSVVAPLLTTSGSRTEQPGPATLSYIMNGRIQFKLNILQNSSDHFCCQLQTVGLSPSGSPGASDYVTLG